MMFFLWKQTGQALLEAVVALPVLILATTAITTTAYFTLGKKLASHWVYQATLCLAKDYPTLFCQNQLQRQSALLPGFSTQGLRYQKRLTHVRVAGPLYFWSQKIKDVSSEIPMPIETATQGALW